MHETLCFFRLRLGCVDDFMFLLFLASSFSSEKLDDGWPESVEEQGLLLLVLRHYITRQYIKDVL